MTIINEKLSEVHECIGYQKYDEFKKYQKFAYIFTLEVDNGEIWYNTLTREVIHVTDIDRKYIASKNKYMMKTLVEKWFYIPADISDKTLVYMFWQAYNSRHPVKGGSLSLATILTTTECNARCPYCYEYGVAKNTMTEETAELSAKYIIKNASNKIHIKWFGGEPLLNTKVIDIISHRMNESGIPYSSSIVSNGYLFDRVTDEQLLTLWKVKNVQITIDGTREQYNKIKMLPADSYDKALNAIERLVGLKIEVMIRTHITLDNADDIRNLVKELGQCFEHLGEKRRYIRLYPAPLFDGLGNNPEQLTDNDRHRLYDDFIAIDYMMLSSGIDRGRGMPRVKPCHCMADNKRSIVITPTGDLTPCEHCSDTEIVGNVIDGGVIPAKWYERTPECEACESCVIYPQCVKLKMCEAEAYCNVDHRRMQMHNVETAVLAVYERYKNRRTSREGHRNSRSGNRISG